jgi:hypothetical protein
MTCICAVAVFVLSSFHPSVLSATARQATIIPRTLKPGVSAAPHGPSASTLRSPQPKPSRKMAVSRTTRPASATGSPAFKNFPGVQNADVVLAGHPISDSAWVCASLTVDVNGDGYPDVVTAQIDGTLNAFVNPGASGVGGAWLSTTNKSAYDPNSVYYLGGIDYMYSADLNGDKLPDMVTVNYTTRTIYVYLNSGQGSFKNATAYQLPFQFAELGGLPASGGLAIGDVDGDGFPDIVALGMQTFTPDGSSSSVEALTLLNHKDGSFAAAQAGEVSAVPGYLLSTYSSVKLADVNGDGHPDLVFVGAEAFSSTLFLAVAPGGTDNIFHNVLPSLPTSQLTGYGISALGSSLILKDIDGDGTVDALFQEGSDVFLAKGHGSGTFDAPASVLSSLGAPQSASFADLNGDGFLDAIVYVNAVTSIYYGTANGQFSSTPVQMPGGARATLGVGDRQVPEPADIDGDGKLDLLGLDTDTGEVGIYLNSATGFHTPQVVVPDYHLYGGMYSAGAGAIQAVGSVDLVTIPDVNGDPQDGSVSPPVLAVSNDGAGNFLPTAYHTLLTSDQTTNVATLLSTKAVAALVDVNGDGLADLLLTSGATGDEIIGGGLALSINKGGYAFSDPVRLTTQQFGFSCYLERTAVGDLNHDQKPDFVTAYRGNICPNAESNPGLPAGFLTYLSQPDGSYVSAFFAYGTAPYIPVLADVNGDGNLDLVLGESEDSQPLSGITVIPGKADGSFDLGAAATVLPNTSLISAIAAGDFDSDGKQDLAVGVLAQLDSSGNPVDNTTGLLLLKGNGDLTFNKGVWYLQGSQVWAERFADFDGDGLPDLALNVTTAAASGYSRATDGAIPEPGLVLLPNLGAGIFGTPQPVFGATSDIGVSIPSPPVDGSLQVADFNGDGAPDVLNDNAYEPTVYFNTGAIKFSVSASASTIVQGSSVTLAAVLQPTVSQKTPGGTASFFANGILLGTAPVQGGQANFQAANLAPGNYSMTAQYSGDANFNAVTAATSVAVSVSTLTPDFSLAAPTPASLSLVAGQAGTITLTLTGNATFSGSVALGCTGAATGMQCLLSPASVSLTPGQTATITVAVTTRGSSSAAARNSASPWREITGGLSFASVFLIALGSRKRKALSAWCALLVLGVFASLGAAGCGGSTRTITITPPDNSTPAGSYSLSITATAGSSTHSQTIPVTVTASK